MSLPTPNTRKEQYLNAIATGNAGGLPTPITREEEYLDAIARSGGGSGDGDMKKSVYDSDLDVAGAGGIKAFVSNAVSGKVDKVEGKGLSTNDYTNEDKAIVGGVTSALAGKVDKVEGKGLSTNDYTDEDKAIVDGVTGALAEKADTEDIPDLVSDNLAKGILGNETVLSTDTVPFVSKIMGTGKYQRKKFIGCSYVWNQLVVADRATVEINEVTFTNNGDGSFTVNGTAVADTICVTEVNFFPEVADGTKVLLRGCPSGGSDTTYGIGLYHRQGGRINAADKGNGAIINITTTGIGYTYIYVKEGCTVNNLVFKPSCHNLTQLFGSTAIADYIYNLEQTTAGAGIAKLKELGFFTEDYYTYDAGSIQSVDIKEYAVTGKNMTIATSDPSNPDLGFMSSGGGTAAMQYDASNGGYYTTGHRRFVFVPEKYGTYTLSIVAKVRAAGSSTNAIVDEIGSQKFPRYKSDYTSEYVRYTGTYELSENRKGIQITIYNSLYIKDMQLELGSTETEYEPYHKTTYSLTPTELRGVPNIDANNNIYCDGDEYASDGEVTRNYGIVDLGELTWTYHETYGFSTPTSGLPSAIAENATNKVGNILCAIYTAVSYNAVANHSGNNQIGYSTAGSSSYILVNNDSYTDAAEFKTAMSGVYLVYKKATPTTETLTPFDYPQSVGSIEEIVDYKVEQEERDVAIPTGHVTEYMGKGGEFTLPTLPETPSVLAFDGHNFFWKPETT